MSTRFRFILFLTVVAAACAMISLPAAAVTIDVDLSGQFQQDNDVFLVNFSLDSDGFVSLFTSSWLSAASGLGFDTALFLWDSNGDWMGFGGGYSDDVGLGGSALSNGTLHDYGENDAFLTAFLGAGSYTVTLVQTGNLPVGFPGPANLADGFTQASEPSYTRDVFAWGPNDAFNGAGGNDPRTGDWALHLVGISDYSIPGGAPIPEPATVVLLGLGAAWCGIRFRKQGS